VEACSGGGKEGGAGRDLRDGDGCCAAAVAAGRRPRRHPTPPKPYLYPPVYTLYHTPYLYPIPYTVYPASYLYPVPHTLYPTPYSLQGGCRAGVYRRALASFPDQDMAQRVLAKYFVEGGKAKDKPYKPLQVRERGS